MRAKIRVSNKLIGRLLGLPDDWLLVACAPAPHFVNDGEAVFDIEQRCHGDPGPPIDATLVYTESIDDYGNCDRSTIYVKLFDLDGKVLHDFGARPLFATALLAGGAT